MTDQNARENAREELCSGHETLTEARVLCDNRLYNGAVARAYYAAFHCARAVLFLRGLETRTHRGVIQMLTLHLVRAGDLPKEAAALLAQLATNRELADYRSPASFVEDDARQAVADAEAFIAACRPLLRGLGVDADQGRGRRT